MKNQKSKMYFFLMSFFLFFINVGNLNSQPTGGNWEIETGFGQIVLTINDEGSYITNLSITFSDYTCNGVTQNGTINKGSTPGWSITNNEFAITTSINPTGTTELTFSGTFSQSGEEASGEWSLNVFGTTCSGEWNHLISNNNSHYGEWKNIGPFMGYINSMAMDNEHTDTVYAATPRGLYRTFDGAENWELLNLPETEIKKVVVSQVQTNKILCISEYNVFLSEDTGESWNVIWSDEYRIQCVAFNPLNPNTILVGTDERYKTSGYTFSTLTKWIYRSTNSGESWDKVNFNGVDEDDCPVGIKYIVVDPADTTKIYVGSENQNGGGMFVSHNNGSDWINKRLYISGEEIYALICTPASYEDHTVCAISTGFGERKFFISKDQGITWTEKGTSSSLNLGVNNADNPVYICNDYPKWVHMGGDYNYEDKHGSVVLFNLDDEGWYYLGNTPLEYPTSYLTSEHADYLGFEKRGVYRYSWRETVYVPKNNGIGISNAEIVDLAFYPVSPGKMIIAMDDNLHKTSNMGQSWTEVGDTYNDKNSVFIFPDDTAKLIAGIHSGWLSYGNSFYIYKSTNGGISWSGQKLFTRYGNITQDYRMWVSEIVGSPGDSDIIFIGVDGGDASAGAGIYKSNDGGSTWEIKRTTGVSAIAVDPVNNDIVYSGTSYAGYVNRSEDSGETWTGISPGGQGYIFECVNDLAVDNSNQVFAATTTGLFTWEGNEDWALVPGFPVTNTTAIVIDNSLEEPVYYVGTSSQGVFTSDDGGETWESFNLGLGSSKITKLKLGKWNPKYLYAGTKNGGVWITLIPGGKIKEYVSICEGESYEGWTESGEYNRTLTSSTGADSIVTTFLTVHMNYETTEDISICEGEIYNGFSEEGQYVRELKTIYGCDSIVTTNITFDPNGMCYYDYLHVPSFEYPTIQSAIDAAEPEDTVLVGDGIYTGDGNTLLSLNEKNIVVKSKNGPENCIIDGEGTGFFGFGDTWSYEGLNAIVEGFTIRNFVGNGFYYYAGASPTLKNNIIEDCGGGGILFWHGSPLIENNIIQNNGSYGIECYSTQARIISNLITNNTSNKGAGIYAENSSASIINNIIVNNQAEKGGGIYSKNSPLSIINNTVVENSVSGGNGTGGAIYIEDCAPDIINNIIAFSTGKGIVSIGENSSPNVLYNDIYGNDGGNYLSGDSDEEIQEISFEGENGNISVDPLLLLDDYSIPAESPCVDAGTPDTTGLNVGLSDFYGNSRIYDGNDDGVARIDIGAFEKQSSTIETEEYISICQGEEYEGYTENTTFQRTLTSTTGMDSIVTTYLTVNPTYESEEYVSICEGEDYLGLTDVGDHQREFESVNGCDSTVTTHLTVNDAYEVTEDIEICEGEDYQGWTETGTYERTLTSVSGCDSVIITNLSVHPSYEPAITISGDTLKSVDFYPTYQWCDENGAISDEINNKFVIDHSGEYHLEVMDENGCVQTSAVVSAIYSSTDITGLNNLRYSVIPNPNRGIFLFRLDSKPEQDLTLKLINPLGQLIEVRTIEHATIHHSERFDASHLSKGMFYLIILNNRGQKVEKIVVQ